MISLLQNPPLGQVLISIIIIGGFIVSVYGVYASKKSTAKIPQDTLDKINKHDAQIRSAEGLIRNMNTILRSHEINLKNYVKK